MDLTAIIDLLSVVAVVSGLIFAGVELRQYRSSRTRESALELFKTWQSLPFLRGYRAISNLPDNQSVKQVEEIASGKMDDIFFLIATLEGMGALVFQGELDLEQVEEFFDGFIIITWKKMQRYIEEQRKIHARESWAEFTQWLAERVIERESKNTVVPAYIKHKDWQYK